MKTLLSAALLAFVASSAAHAEGLQLETRVFHAAKNVRATSETVYFNGQKSGTNDKVEHSYDTTTGVGLAASFNVIEQLDAGIGFSLARYYPGTDVQQQDQALQLFTRYNLQKSESSKAYLLAGVSEHRLSDKVDAEDGVSLHSSYTPIVNYDLGLGGSLKIGSADLGLEYKYSNTLAKAHAQVAARGAVDGFGLVEAKSRYKGVELEGHEISLTLGVQL